MDQQYILILTGHLKSVLPNRNNIIFLILNKLFDHASWSLHRNFKTWQVTNIAMVILQSYFHWCPSLLLHIFCLLALWLASEDLFEMQLMMVVDKRSFCACSNLASSRSERLKYFWNAADDGGWQETFLCLLEFGIVPVWTFEIWLPRLIIRSTSKGESTNGPSLIFFNFSFPKKLQFILLWSPGQIIDLHCWKITHDVMFSRRYQLTTGCF